MLGIVCNFIIGLIDVFVCLIDLFDFMRERNLATMFESIVEYSPIVH